MVVLYDKYFVRLERLTSLDFVGEIESNENRESQALEKYQGPVHRFRTISLVVLNRNDIVAKIVSTRGHICSVACTALSLFP